MSMLSVLGGFLAWDSVLLGFLHSTLFLSNSSVDGVDSYLIVHPGVQASQRRGQWLT